MVSFGSLVLLAAASCATAVQAAADILIVEPVSNGPATESYEYTQATDLGLSIDIKTLDEFQALTTAQFSQYKALIINPYGRGDGPDQGYMDFLVNSKARWGPAVTGNVVLVGTDPGYHAPSTPGAVAVIRSSISFTSSGSSTGFYLQTPDGLYTSSPTDLGFLSDVFGEGTSLDVGYGSDAAHLVATHPALLGLSDADLSNWHSSVHCLWRSYPAGFQPLAIVVDAGGSGTQTFADGTTGVPYIIARGAIPSSCGNSVVNAGEECDDGSENGTGDSLCSGSCTCLYGVSTDDSGTKSCKKAPRCGDSKVDTGEQCDNGDEGSNSNGSSDSLCMANCQCKYGVTTDDDGKTECKAPSCGDGTINQDSEECDDGSDNGEDDSLCSSSCKCVYGEASGGGCLKAPVCGDGLVNGDDECDDGDDNGDDGTCSSTCTCIYGTRGDFCAPKPVCGDGFINGDDECDDGELNGGEGSVCSDTCECVYGVASEGGDSTDPTCNGPPSCGDGRVDEPDEQCDDGDDNDASSSLCAASCTCKYGLAEDGTSCGEEPTCGDGVVGYREECDDGDDNSDDRDATCGTTCLCNYGLDEDETTCKDPPVMTTTIPGTVIGDPETMTPTNPGTVDPTDTISRDPATPSNPPIVPIDGPDVPEDVVGIEYIYYVEDADDSQVQRRHNADDQEAEPDYTRAIYTRQIYATQSAGRPWYPKVIGTPTGDALETVFTTSRLCRTPDPTPTFTYKLCIDCPLSTTTAAVPGYTPGVCVGCTLVGELAASRCTEPISLIRPQSASSTATAVATNAAGVVTEVVATKTLTITTTCSGPRGPCAPVTTCQEYRTKLTVPWEYCTTFVLTKENGARTTCTEALPLSALPTSMLEKIGYSTEDSSPGSDSGHAGSAVQPGTSESGNSGSGSGPGGPAVNGTEGHGTGLNQDQPIQVAGAMAAVSESLVGKILFAITVAMLY